MGNKYKKKTATWIEKLGQQIIEKEEYAIGVTKESITTIPKCCDQLQYIFNIKTGEIIITGGWADHKMIMQCRISD